MSEELRLEIFRFLRAFFRSESFAKAALTAFAMKVNDYRRLTPGEP